MPTNFRIGDRVEDKETHKRGRVTFVYSTLELRDEFIAVLFDGRVETLFRLTAFAKSQRGSHDCRSCDLIAAAVCLATPATAAEFRRAPLAA
jgi:hypothetical protein